MNQTTRQNHQVAKPITNLQQQLAVFLLKRRGEQSQVAFAKQVGISVYTLRQLERGKQNSRLSTVQRIMKGLKSKLSEIFTEC